MKKWSLTGLSFVIVILLSACVPPPAIPTASPTPEGATGEESAQLDGLGEICGFVNQPDMKLGVTREAEGVTWLREREAIRPNEYVPHVYDWEGNLEHYSVFFYEERLLAGERQPITGISQPLPMKINFGQIVKELGEPDYVKGRLGWLTCENGCPYYMSLIYIDLGVIIDTYGVSLEATEIGNNVFGVALDESMTVNGVLCFVPGELDTYYANAFTTPITVNPKYVHEWEGFGMIVPIPP